MPARNGRGNLEPRALTVQRGVNRYAEGSSLVKLGHTEILCTVTLENAVPKHVLERRDENGKKLPPTGWLMAEYALLPRATHERTQRERLRVGGRTQEIQRLLGRAFRAVVDLDLFKHKTLIIDCEVLQADGGTRVTSVLAGYAALYDLCDRMTRAGTLDDWAIRAEVGAVSVGLVDGEIRLDLEYTEDSRAQADFNLIATNDGRIIEVQGGSEGESISHAQFLEMVGVGLDGVKVLLERMKTQLR
ncbi:MAG: ribonuclease PH [Pleurocapsa sp. SU_196_0]|nr:ribonuclease PH [Pleurocapsa sp. SU_196_0]